MKLLLLLFALLFLTAGTAVVNTNPDEGEGFEFWTTDGGTTTCNCAQIRTGIKLVRNRPVTGQISGSSKSPTTSRASFIGPLHAEGGAL